MNVAVDQLHYRHTHLCALRFYTHNTEVSELVFYCILPPKMRGRRRVARPSWLLIDGAGVVIECVSSAVKVGQTHHTVLCIECMFVLR